MRSFNNIRPRVCKVLRMAGFPSIVFRSSLGGRMKRREFLYASGLTVIAPAIAERAQSDERFDELCKIVETKMAEYHVPGVSYGVLKNGKRMTR